MQVIRFTYNSAEVETSVFLFTYFRMNGIYIYERFFNLETGVRNRILGALPITGVEYGVKIYDSYDMELYLIQNESEYLMFQKMGGYTERTIVLAKGNWQSKYKDFLDEGKTIDCESYPRNSCTLIVHLLECMNQSSLISIPVKSVLERTAQIYCENRVIELFFAAKYFYIAEDDEQFKRIIGWYYRVSDALLSTLGQLECGWADPAYVNLQYAALYMAYEGDLYCARNKKPFLYTAESISRNCLSLLKKKEIEFMLGESFHLLLAQVYDDLLNDGNQAYVHYLQTCKDYNAYAYFKKALYLREVENNPEKSMYYLAKSIVIYPCYYRAWHIIGLCCVEAHLWEQAIRAFDNLKVILGPRLQNNVLRPMEIEYLFKALNQSGDILFQNIQDAPRAIEEYLAAERVWRAIDETDFMRAIFSDRGEEERIRKKLKQELNVNRVYSKLAELYRCVGDKEKSEEFLGKIYQ